MVRLYIIDLVGIIFLYAAQPIMTEHLKIRMPVTYGFLNDEFYCKERSNISAI